MEERTQLMETCFFQKWGGKTINGTNGEWAFPNEGNIWHPKELMENQKK